MDLTILDDVFTCPRCKKENRVVIEHKNESDKKHDRIKCVQCAVYFYRVGWSNYFASPDEHRVFIVNANTKIS